MRQPLAIIGIFLSILSVSDCRVKFTHSSLYDEYDFIGKTSIEIEECSNVKQCAIFVSILSDANKFATYFSIKLSSELNEWNVTLPDLAEMRNHTTKEIEPYFLTSGDKETTGMTYFYNDNENQIAAPLVIYAVNLDKETNFANTAGVFDAADLKDGIVQGKIVTILSARQFKTTITGAKDTVATIFATGFDNADPNDNNPDNCRRVMATRFDDVVSFQINGPITSIYFSDFQGKLIDSENSIKTLMKFDYDKQDLISRGFVTSQGYIGCKTGEVYKSSLYTYDDYISYSLFSEKSHFVHQAAFVYTDDERPLNVQTDKSLHNFLGKDLLTPEQVCDETHKLEVHFNQSTTNSFALVFDYSNVNCDDEVITVPTTLKTTTTKVPEVKPTTSANVDSTTTKPQDSYSTTANLNQDSTTSSAFGFGVLYLLVPVINRIFTC